MASNEYWEKRFVQLEDAQTNKGIEYFHELEKQYSKAARNVEKELASWYGRLAVNNEISMAEAKKMLTTNELKEFRWTVEDYIKAGKENAIDGRWVKQLENASARVHISRLEAMKVQMQQQIEMLYGNEYDSMNEFMKGIFTDSYYRTAFEIQKGFGVGYDLMKLDPKRVERVISKPWAADGSNFSSRIWKQKNQLVSDLQNGLTQAAITGSTPEALTKYVKSRFEVSTGQAGRLVMTETSFFHSAGQKEMFNDLGVEEYEICATLDNKTSEICRDLDGKVLKMSEFQPGVTAPPFHCWCRTTTVPYFNDEFTIDETRAARDEETGKTYYVPSDMKYRDWKESFINSGSKEGFNEVVDTHLENNGNQVYNFNRIDGEHSREDDLKATNPNYKKPGTDKKYTHNCQRCVSTYEARRRGYDVEAKPRILDGTDRMPYMFDKENGWTSVYKNIKAILCSSNTGKKTGEKVIQKMAEFGEGSRAIVRVQWQKKYGGGGHVFIAEQVNGKTIFIDPQNNNMDVSNYFSLAKKDETYVLRIDNLEFTSKINECCKNRG